MPVIMEATGTISKSFRNILSNPGKHGIKELQKTAMLSTEHILRKLLTQNYKAFNTRNNTTCAKTRNYKTATAAHTLET